MAANSGRLLFVYWQRPARLEEFLVPPEHGIDWRVPDWLLAKFQPMFSPTWLSADGIWRMQEKCDTNTSFVETTSNFGDMSGPWYDEKLNRGDNEPNFATVYHDLWSLLFEPSPPIQNLIATQMNELKLEPMQYDALHLCMHYFVNEFEENPQLVDNATKCVLYGFDGAPTLPMYVASDVPATKTKAIQFAANITTLPFVTRTVDGKPLHLDRGSDYEGHTNGNRTREVEPYFETFVDLFILSQAR